MNPNQWTKSSHSGGSGCVEARASATAVHVRDSKGPASPVLTFRPDRWRELIEAVKAL